MKDVRTWIEIDQNALRHNAEQFFTLIAPRTRLMAVIKSNAYGHGLVQVALLLAELGSRNKESGETIHNSKFVIPHSRLWFGADSIIEALRLRREGIQNSILVLGHTLPSRVGEAASKNITLTVSNFEALRALAAAKKRPAFHLKIDTGMHRQGFLPREIPQLLLALKSTKLAPEGIYTHFASAKDPVDPNFIHGRAILDLGYLAEIFQNKNSRLNVQAVFAASVFLMYVLTEYTSGRTRYVRPTPQNLFQLMTASTAMSFVHWPLNIDGKLYIDGGLPDPLPFAKALADGHDEVVIVHNKPRGFWVGSRYDMFSHLLAMVMPRQIAHLVRTLKSRFQEIEQGFEQESRLKVIRPKTQLPLKSILDTNKARLNACVDMGIADAKEFLRTYRS